MQIQQDLYGDQLARIHVDGYGFHWKQAAPAILAWLTQSGIDSGLVVDLGCGGGQWLHSLNQKGYAGFGVDVSPAMIKIAQSNAPKSDFRCGSFDDVQIPECDAVTSLGEPLNYMNSGPAMKKTIRNVFRSLRSNGLFVFDVRHPANRPIPARDHATSDSNWFCHARIEEDGQQLTRFITTFTRTGKSQFRRDEETHRLKLYSKSEMLDWLRQIGFRVRTRQSYGDYTLGPRQSVFICRKPK